MSFRDWATVPSSNASVGSINWAEGMTPGAVNNSARQTMADVAQWRDDNNGTLTSSGGPAAYTITTNEASSANFTGLTLRFKCNATNNSTVPTLNRDSLGAKAFRKVISGSTPDQPLAVGDLLEGQIHTARYSSSIAGSSGGWLLENPGQVIAQQFVPTTTIVPATANTVNLGSTAAPFNGLTVKSGAVVNFGNGNVTVTHSTDTLTLGGTSAKLNLADKVLQRPVVRDYGETVNALGNLGSTSTINLELGNVVTATVNSTVARSIAFTNPPASGTAGSFTLLLTAGGQAASFTWPNGTRWAGGTAPTLSGSTAATSAVDILTFATVNGGTNWYGFAAGLDMSS